MALITAAVITAGAAAYGAYSTRQQSKAQKKSLAAQQRQADIANARERRGLLRASRVNRASVESQAALSGTIGSSSTNASMSNIQSRTGENLSFLDQNAQLSAQASAANAEAASWASRNATVQAVAGVATGYMGQFLGPKPQGTA